MNEEKEEEELKRDFNEEECDDVESDVKLPLNNVVVKTENVESVAVVAEMVADELISNVAIETQSDTRSPGVDDVAPVNPLDTTDGRDSDLNGTETKRATRNRNKIKHEPIMTIKKDLPPKTEVKSESTNDVKAEVPKRKGGRPRKIKRGRPPIYTKEEAEKAKRAQYQRQREKYEMQKVRALGTKEYF